MKYRGGGEGQLRLVYSDGKKDGVFLFLPKQFVKGKRKKTRARKKRGAGDEISLGRIFFSFFFFFGLSTAGFQCYKYTQHHHRPRRQRFLLVQKIK